MPGFMIGGTALVVTRQHFFTLGANENPVRSAFKIGHKKAVFAFTGC